MAYGRNVPILDIELDEQYLANLLVEHATDWVSALDFIDKLASSRSQYFNKRLVESLVVSAYAEEK